MVAGMNASVEPTGDPDVGALSSAIYDALAAGVLLDENFPVFETAIRQRAEFEIRSAIAAWVEDESA